jgi:hypothetical protein
MRFRNDGAREEELAAIRDLAEQTARLEGQITELTRQKDRTRELRGLEERIETLKLEKDRLTEAHQREVRDAEHRAGLLLRQSEWEVKNAKRQTELEVREGNLAREREAFTKDMEFVQGRMQGEVDRIERVMAAVLERLPAVQATFTKTEGGPRAARRGKGAEAED